MAENTNKGKGRYIVNGVLVDAWGTPVEAEKPKRKPATKKRATRAKAK